MGEGRAAEAERFRGRPLGPGRAGRRCVVGFGRAEGAAPAGWPDWACLGKHPEKARFCYIARAACLSLA